MQIAVFLVELVIIMLGTLGVVQFDRRRRQPQLRDPSMTTVVLLGLLLNFACLPYYFARTRSTGKGLAIGIGAMLGVYAVTMIAGALVAMIGVAVG
jgi:hypothetical protein